ncbi:MAG: 30S ribosomal protein S2 [Planctomycetota bacterium]
MSAIVTIRELLDAGVHFGHKTSRWNPKMGPYIVKQKNRIHIINLKETVRALFQARHFLREMAAQGKTILFVGTKRQATVIVEKEARRCGMPFINNRWLGGFLTNRDVVLARIDKYHEMTALESTKEFQVYSKKQIARHNTEKERIHKNLAGVMELTTVPDMLLVVGLWDERIAVTEARSCKVPIVAIADTDSDPRQVDCAIPANDESFRAITVIMGKLTDAIVEGRQRLNIAKDTSAVSFGPEKDAAKAVVPAADEPKKV